MRPRVSARGPGSPSYPLYQQDLIPARPSAASRVADCSALTAAHRVPQVSATTGCRKSRTARTSGTVPGVQLGYARVSTAKQDLDRQLDALTTAGIPTERVYLGKKSGATTDPAASRRSLFSPQGRHRHLTVMLSSWRQAEVGS